MDQVALLLDCRYTVLYRLGQKADTDERMKTD